ncbi:MAG: hypothetical protein HZA52_19390 [Planctomycetes bacterium]|nr:hypothetical protein [Planctomycetota bacterium]
MERRARSRREHAVDLRSGRSTYAARISSSLLALLASVNASDCTLAHAAESQEAELHASSWPSAPPAAAASLQSAPSGTEPPLFIVLTETGETRDGLPVLAVHPEAERIAATLDRGLTHELLGLYRMEQHYLRVRKGVAPEPAYLLLSSQDGGFARYGFFLGDQPKRDVAFVDLKRDQPLTGRFAAVDQLFPHELAHALRHQLVGPATGGEANQVHAIGVRTDPGVAFDEGFAEHFQVLAIDHPDAAPDTRALASSSDELARVHERFARYRRELEARVAFATPLRVGFALWFSHGEQVQRYHAVKANAFAREPELPKRLLDREDPYGAYLLENMLPGEPSAPPKPLARMTISEGVVSALFVRWLREPALLETRREESFYIPFGVRADEPTALQNAYLKLLYVLDVHAPTDVLALIDGYERSFPDEAPAVARVTDDVFLGRAVARAPEVWLASPEFRIGTTVFDQFRGLPRVHTFELGAASLVDWLTVPGVDEELARQLLAGAPYARIEDVATVSGVTPELVARLRGMQSEFERLIASPATEEESLSILAILMPSVRRLGAALVLGAIAGAVLFRWMRAKAGAPATWMRSCVAGVAASALGWPCAWVAGELAGVGALAGVAVVFGLPAAAWCLARKRGPAVACASGFAWVGAAVPMALFATPWG